MARRRVVWTEHAELIFRKILEFYVIRNSSKTYSRKLNKEIKEYLKLLPKHPYLGRPSSYKNVRVIIYRNYKIFYSITSKEIVIHLVWDYRQNPNDLGID